MSDTLTPAAQVRIVYDMVKKTEPRRPLSGPDFQVGRTRIDMKVPPEIRELLVDASAVVYESLTGFVLHSAVERARKIIKDPERILRVEEALRRLPYVRY